MRRTDQVATRPITVGMVTPKHACQSLWLLAEGGIPLAMLNTSVLHMSCASRAGHVLSARYLQVNRFCNNGRMCWVVDESFRIVAYCALI